MFVLEVEAYGACYEKARVFIWVGGVGRGEKA